MVLANLLILDLYGSNQKKSSFWQDNFAFLVALGLLSCGLGYKWFSKETDETKAERLKQDREKEARFEQKRKRTYEDAYGVIQREYQERMLEYEERRRRGIPRYLNVNLANLYDECNETYARTPFQILGIDDNADLEEIKGAYRRRALEAHPDKNKENPKAKERFQLIAACNERCRLIQEYPPAYGL